ncbi:MAG: SMC protein, partial [uncultured bacterium]
AVWQPLGITPGTPREMKQWLLRVDKLLANARSAESAVREARRLNEECARLKAAVSHQIAAFDPTREVGTMSLEVMISLCEQRVEQEERHLEKKRQLQHRLNETEIRLKRTDEELKTIAADQATWLREWSQAIDGLGLQPNAHPEHVTELFEQLAAFFDTIDRSEELRKRIYGMDQVAEKFERRVFEFADAIGLQRDGQGANTIAARLNRDLNTAREARASLKKIETQQKDVAEEIANADITIRSARECLTELRDLAGVTVDEELQQAGERSRHSRELRQKLETLEQELSRNGDGLSIADLEKEVEESDIDAIDGELTRVVAELGELQAHRDAHRDRRQTLSNEIETKKGSAAAANASEEAEQQLAVMISGAEQYLRCKIAALILEQRIEEYRRKNQAPVLAKAGALFARLTLGSYVNIRAELDATNKPILLGVRSDDQEVPIEGMSDGSRDQLYLALRLATLMQHLRRGEPIPFVVDDILLGFDDRRTSACLEVLAELAAETQVLLFTHHRRVMELAEPIEAQAGIYLHEL